MQQDNAPDTARSIIQPFRRLRSIYGRPVDQGVRPEYARPALPSWVLALVAVVLVYPFIAQTHDRVQAPRATRTQASPVRLCGPGWQVRRIGADSYAATASGIPSRVIPTSCTMPVDPAVAVVLVHITGTSAEVSTGLTTSGRLAVPAGGWWQVPVDRAHKTIVVTPDPHGGSASVTIYAPNQFPSVNLP
jgi:hypothetical protein